MIIIIRSHHDDGQVDKKSKEYECGYSEGYGEAMKYVESHGGIAKDPLRR